MCFIFNSKFSIWQPTQHILDHALEGAIMVSCASISLTINSILDNIINITFYGC